MIDLQDYRPQFHALERDISDYLERERLIKLDLKYADSIDPDEDSFTEEDSLPHPLDPFKSGERTLGDSLLDFAVSSISLERLTRSYFNFFGMGFCYFVQSLLAFQEHIQSCQGEKIYSAELYSCDMPTSNSRIEHFVTGVIDGPVIFDKKNVCLGVNLSDGVRGYLHDKKLISSERLSNPSVLFLSPGVIDQGYIYSPQSVIIVSQGKLGSFVQLGRMADERYQVIESQLLE